MRITTEAFLLEAAKVHPMAAQWIKEFLATARKAKWKNIIELRQFYPTADAVEVKSGRMVMVFNVRRNHFRFVAGIHFNSQRIYTLRFMTHAEYSRDLWKNEL